MTSTICQANLQSAAPPLGMEVLEALPRSVLGRASNLQSRLLLLCEELLVNLPICKLHAAQGIAANS